MTQQLTFEWQAAPKIRQESPKTGGIPDTFLPGVDGPIIRPAGSAAPRRSLRDAVERYFVERKIAYVDVDEAKRALFASSKLGAFHFVAHNRNGPNWLVWAAHVRKESREDMRQWEEIFGTGFVAVFAKQSADGQFKFRTLAGEAVNLQ